MKADQAVQAVFIHKIKSLLDTGVPLLKLIFCSLCKIRDGSTPANERILVEFPLPHVGIHNRNA